MPGREAGRMKRTVSVSVLVVAVIVAVVFTTQRMKREAGQPRNVLTPQLATDAAQPGRDAEAAVYSRRQLEPSGYILTDAQDPEFVGRVLPIVRGFLATLDRAGAN